MNLFFLARKTGFEPATSAVTGRRSNQLSYSRVGVGIILILPEPEGGLPSRELRDFKVSVPFSQLSRHG